MPHEHVFRSTLEAMSRFFVGDATLADTLTGVSKLAESVVTPAAMVGITLMVDGRPSTAIFTDGEAPEIDTSQYETGVGPCLDAFRNGKRYRIDDTAEEDRWPSFARTALEHGVRSTLSLPLSTGGAAAFGAMNFYSCDAAAFTDDVEDTAAVFAGAAATALANAQAYWDAHQLSEDLQAAIKTRAVIEQAKGILMSQSHIGEDEAFTLLIHASQRENRKLRDIAAELVQRAVERDPS